ncbi:hypothetical protein DFJ74DRAFT_76757 [Hyaloraphidium curvatum]|nr:hypothetical protein DFJ74DRAFT_76757 [Hyaloraphidium curvatum]
MACMATTRCGATRQGLRMRVPGRRPQGLRRGRPCIHSNPSSHPPSAHRTCSNGRPRQQSPRRRAQGAAPDRRRQGQAPGSPLLFAPQRSSSTSRRPPRTPRSRNGSPRPRRSSRTPTPRRSRRASPTSRRSWPSPRTRRRSRRSRPPSAPSCRAPSTRSRPRSPPPSRMGRDGGLPDEKGSRTRDALSGWNADEIHDCGLNDPCAPPSVRSMVQSYTYKAPHRQMTTAS